MADAKPAANRPLSPHLQIYKPLLTMVMSILHRITGAGLYLATLLFAWWLIAAAGDADYFAFVNDLYASVFGRLVLFAVTWALMHHALGGVRHLIWDLGHGFGARERNLMALMTIVGSVTLTVLLWIVAYMARGG